MPIDLSQTFVVGISATALFDLKAADTVFRNKFKDDPTSALNEYRSYMLQHENDTLAGGTGMELVKALLSLNTYKKPEDAQPLTEVVVMSRNSPETGVCVLSNIRSSGLSITRSAFSGGESVTEYLPAYDVDLFLTTNTDDAQKVADSQTCAVALVKAPPSEAAPLPSDQVRIAFDGDAVLFDEDSEIVYKTKGMDAFRSNEDTKQDQPMRDGPYAVLLRKLSKLQKRLPFGMERSPVRIAIVTSRNAPAELRVIKTLRSWEVYVNEIFFLGGVEKTQILRAFNPHIFFDDQDFHLDKAAKYVPSGRVPYKSNSPLRVTG